MAWNQARMPLVEAMAAYLRENPQRYHTPGHKGKPIKGEVRELLGDRAFQSDLTEVPGLDDLHHPQGPIKEAQALAAAAFGAAHSFFLVNGASAGIMASFLALMKPGDKVLLPRHIHKSVFNSLVLSGVEPVYLAPTYHEVLALPLGIPEASWEKAWQEHPDAKFIFLIHPNYEGLVSIHQGLVEKAKEQGLVVLVDEAHGGHFSFHPRLPPSALALGADVVVHGSHKTIGSLTQSGMLHLGPRMEPGPFQDALGMVESTSPSYLLLASLDGARQQLALKGEESLDKLLNLAQEVRNQSQALEGIHLWDEELYTYDEIKGFDPSKIIIDALELGLTGYELAIILRKNHGIQLEMATHGYGLALLTLGDDREQGANLIKGLTKIARTGPLSLWKKQGFLPFNPNSLPLPQVIVNPRESHFANKKSIPLEEGANKICGELIIPYPPGIPLLCPGELITGEMVDWLSQLRTLPLNWQGLEDNTLQRIRILTD